MGRRGHDEGAIYQRESDGKWVAAVSLGYDADGKRKRKVFYGDTRKEVAERLKTALHEQQQGTLPTRTERQTVAQYLNDWLANSVKPTVRARTYASYKQLCDLYIIPHLGKRQLSQLSPQQIRAFLNHLAEQKVQRTGEQMSGRTVQYCYSVLRRALGQAVKLGLLGRNAATMIDPPKITRHDAHYLTPEQATAFLKSVKGHRLECLYMLAITLGMREGELLGLAWDAVDLDKRTVAVRQALQRIEGKLQLVEPKTARSKRVITLPKAAVATLKEHRIRQLEERLLAGTKWEEHNLVFPNTEGKPSDARNLVRAFHKALDQAGLARINFHSLRHTCASLLLAQGVPMRVVMEVLGHTQISMTMDLYSHVVPELKRQAADRMDDLLGTG